MTPARKARKSLRLTIYDVAKKAGVTAATVSRIECQKQDCTADTAAALAKVLGIPEEQILYPARYMEQAA
nr:helix-turn-helix transcriptional regulator [Dechloromonas sp.]